MIQITLLPPIGESEEDTRVTVVAKNDQLTVQSPIMVDDVLLQPGTSATFVFDNGKWVHVDGLEREIRGGGGAGFNGGVVSSGGVGGNDSRPIDQIPPGSVQISPTRWRLPR